MKTRQSAYATLAWWAAMTVCLAACSTAARAPYIANDVDVDIELVPSTSHEFTYVRIYEDHGEFVLYGKISHSHSFRDHGGHVDFVILDADGGVLDSGSLPLVNRGNRISGWRGAHFRTRLPKGMGEASNIRLVVHDPPCQAGSRHDCGENVAASAE